MFQTNSIKIKIKIPNYSKMSENSAAKAAKVVKMNKKGEPLPTRN